MNLLYSLIIYPLYLIIEVSYTLVYKVLHNTGFAVIGVSVAITLLCLPLYAVAEHWQEVERNTQKKLKPGLERIKAVFSGDERYMITTAFYKENHYSPIMGLRSSFGLLIQIPFFMAAYSYLSHLSALQGHSFLFIRDMGAPDALFSIGSFPVNVLPIAMTLINCAAGFIYARGHGAREQVQIYGMALIFLVILYNSPAGLVLYWTFNNIFSLVKNIFYKLKKPLLTFWLLICALCIPALLFILFGFRTKAAYKAIAAFAVAVIYALPLIVRAANRLLDKTLAPLTARSKARFFVYLLACVHLAVLTGLTIPTSLISSSPVEFAGIGEVASPLSYVVTACMQAAGLFLFWPVCVYFLFGKRVQTLLATLLCGLAFIASVNAFCFMLNYGDVSATLTFLDAVKFRTFSAVSLLNLLVMAVLLAATVIALPRLDGKLCAYIHGIAAAALFAFSLMNVSVINREFKAFVANGNLNEVEIEPIFHLSRNKQNVVVFMLDRAESQFVPDMFAEDESFADTFSGFTYYPNTLSFNGHTLMGAPLIYGRYEYSPWEMNRRKDELLYKKNNEALLMLPRIFTEQADFRAVITDPSYANYSAYADVSITAPYPKIDGYQTIGKYSTAWYKTRTDADGLDNTDSILRHNMFIFSMFRASPIVLRELVYQKGKYWNSNGSATSYTDIINNYAPLDFLPDLTDFADTESGTYMCMVNELTHASVFMQAPDYVPAAKITDKGTSRFKDEDAYHTNMAAFKRIAAWIRLLKAEGVYDNTRIILVADHSRATYEDGMEKDDALDEQLSGDNYRGRGHFHPLLMVKDFGATGAPGTDGSFMTNADVPSIALSGIVEAPVNPFTGKAVPTDTAALKKDGVLITCSDVHQAWLFTKLHTYPVRDDQWWRVKDDVFKASSWTHENVR